MTVTGATLLRWSHNHCVREDYQTPRLSSWVPDAKSHKDLAMTSSHNRYLQARLRALGCSASLSKELVALVSRWIKESGPEWTVSRLKLLKTSYLRFIAGEAYELPNVATRRRQDGRLMPKGPFGVLWQATDCSLRSKTRALNAMMIYSDLIAPAVTEKQWRKFHASATRPEPSPDGVRLVLDQIRVPKWMRVDPGSKLLPFEQFVVGKGYSPSFVADHISRFIDSDSGMYLWDEYPQYKEVMKAIAGPISTRFNYDDYFGYHEPLTRQRCLDPVGRLGCTQEPGYKLRVFAAPNIVHQCAMSRMKAQLFTLLQRVTWDCTYDQASGTAWAQSVLDQGDVVWSIDLSDATNNFPLDLQLEILRKVGCHESDIKLFHDLSRLPWVSTHDDGKQLVRWTVGQPLGLGPSFAAFALSHGVLVHSLQRMLGLNDSFRVLGDDIIIRGDALAQRYLDVLRYLDIPISVDKTIRSTSLAEFAGKIVTKDGILASVKWREASDRSFVDFVRNIGPSAKLLLRPRQRKVVDFLSVLPEPHGFGWNPHGLPASLRVAMQLAFEQALPQRYLTFRPVQKSWVRITMAFRESYLKPSFQYRPEGEYWGACTGSAGAGFWAPRPGVAQMEPSLRISEDTGAPFKVLEQSVYPQLRKYLESRGFAATETLTTDPRGVSPLDDLESKIAKVYELLEQDGIAIPT